MKLTLDDIEVINTDDSYATRRRKFWLREPRSSSELHPYFIFELMMQYDTSRAVRFKVDRFICRDAHANLWMYLNRICQ
jgi:hypothetical protein